MRSLFPYSEPADGLDLVVARPLAWGETKLEVGERFDYRALKCHWLTVRELVTQGALRITRFVVTAVRAFAYGPRELAAGDVVPHVDLGISDEVLEGLRATGAVTITLLPAEARPAKGRARAARA